jgi:hypothetical protein
MFTATVRTKRTAPRAMIELVPSPGCASENWFTMLEPSVAPGAASECGHEGELPITMATAMASPKARPTASVVAAAIPGRAAGQTTFRTTCQRVAPRAMAASRSATGTARRAVRDSDTSVGRVIMASTTAARTMLGPRSSPPNSRPSTGTECRKGSTSRANRGDSTSRAQSPTTMLGTAASSSTRVEAAPAILDGTSSDRATAAPSPMGAAMMMATPVVTTVPTMRRPAAYWPELGE